MRENLEKEISEKSAYQSIWTDWLPGGFGRYMKRTQPAAEEIEEMYGCFKEPDNFQRKRILRGIDLANCSLLEAIGIISAASYGLARLFS